MSDKKMELPTAEQLSAEFERLKYKSSFRKILWNTISSIIVAVSIAALISTMFVPVLRVTGTSMTPTLQNDELILCLKNSDFSHGDIVAFYYNNKLLLKRVIGVAGDVVSVGEDGTVSLNGEVIDEPYINEKSLGECDMKFPYQVPEGRIFVMGDHRAVSIDSRSSAVGCISEEYVVGKAVLRVYPIDNFGLI